MSAALTFNGVLTEIIQNIGKVKGKITEDEFNRIVDTAFKDLQPRGPEIMLKSNLMQKLNEKETVKEKILVVSETWSL